MTKYVPIKFCNNCSMPKLIMALKVELVLTVYKQENEQKKKCRDKTPKGEKLPKLKNN